MFVLGEEAHERGKKRNPKKGWKKGQGKKGVNLRWGGLSNAGPAKWP